MMEANMIDAVGNARPEARLQERGGVSAPTSFASLRFTAAQLAEIFGVSKTIMGELERDGIIKGQTVPYGKGEKKVYDWQDVIATAQRFSSRLAKPKSNKVKVFANLKGGVGKSTLASQVAMRASMGGIKTLLIDMDPQAHATLALGITLEEDGLTMRDLIIGRTPAAEVIREITPLLSIIPANLGLSTLEMELFPQTNREQKLPKVIQELRDGWDLIIVDTNPSASVVNISAILAADELCIVAATDFLSVTGLKKLFSILEDLQKEFDAGPEVRIIPNLFDVRDGISQESIGTLRKFYGSFLANTVVRKNTDMRESQKLGQAIWQFDRKSTGSEDIASLTKELLTEITQ